MRMKKIILSAYTALYISISLQAQTDSTFVRTIYNADEDIYIVMNLIDKNITIPNQDFMGEMAGYIGDDKDFRKWLIIEAKFINVKTAQLSICNDEGTEDLEATLTINPDNTYTLKQGNGSTLRTARNRKWHKLPNTLIFTTTRKKNK